MASFKSLFLDHAFTRPFCFGSKRFFQDQIALGLDPNSYLSGLHLAALAFDPNGFFLRLASWILRLGFGSKRLLLRLELWIKRLLLWIFQVVSEGCFLDLEALWIQPVLLPSPPPVLAFIFIAHMVQSALLVDFLFGYSGSCFVFFVDLFISIYPLLLWTQTFLLMLATDLADLS